jgi:dienelactone hydrolase
MGRFARLLVMWAACAGAFAQDSAKMVTFPSVTFRAEIFAPLVPGANEGEPATTYALLRIPEADRRVPAVVILHGCAGVSTSHHAMARLLQEKGFASLVVNSLTGRGLGDLCSGRIRMNTATQIADAYRAFDMLAADPRIDASRIAVLGYALGGRAALWAGHARWRERLGGARFAAHAAFYPESCYIALADMPERDARIRIFHGTEDHFVPIDGCRTYVSRLRTAGIDVAMKEYIGARHGFDAAEWQNAWAAYDANFRACAFVERDGVLVDGAGAPASPASACVTRGGWLGYGAQAQRDATADLLAFLDETLRASR